MQPTSQPIPAGRAVTLSANAFTIAHNGAPGVLLTITSSGSISGGIAAGTVQGQELEIYIETNASSRQVTIPNSGNAALRGDWVRNSTKSWLKVVWDGSTWKETGRDRGNVTSASGRDATAEGTSTVSQGQASHAEGSGTTATALASHAEGSGTLASQPSGHAEGDMSYAQAHAAHAEGTQSAANGDSSHAEGNSCVANGAHSNASGTQAVTNLPSQRGWANGCFVTQGDAQVDDYILMNAFGGAGGEAFQAVSGSLFLDTVFTDYGGQPGHQTIIPPASCLMYYKAVVLCRENGWVFNNSTIGAPGGEGAGAWLFEGVMGSEFNCQYAIGSQVTSVIASTRGQNATVSANVQTVFSKAYIAAWSDSDYSYTDVTEVLSLQDNPPPSLFPASVSGNYSMVYLGNDSPFYEVWFNTLTPGAGGYFTVEFWDGNQWSQAGCNDGTSSLTLAGLLDLTGVEMWAPTAVNGTTKYWIRLRCEGDFSTIPLCGRIVPRGLDIFVNQNTQMRYGSYWMAHVTTETIATPGGN